MWDMGFDSRFGDLIFERIPHGIFTVDGEGRITSFNHAAEEMTGWHREEVIGRPCAEVFQSTHCQTACFLRSSIERGEKHLDREVTILRRDGRPVRVAVSTAALLDSAGVAGGVEMFRDLSDVEELRRHLKAAFTEGDIVSKSPAMRAVKELLPLVARSDSTVLIEGEPGTGKELVARAIHNLGPRRDKPFIALNCGALPDSLVESELFGYTRGAFTGADRDKPGRFAAAEGGTLLLDEVGDLSPAMQVKLLRVLQEREFTPLGSVRTIKANVRVLAATNRDLALEVANGRFRQDLYFRLNVVRVSLPPLRCRTEDIAMLVEWFVQRFNRLQGRRIAGVAEAAMSALLGYSFPGNVRELENAIEHAFVVCPGPLIEPGDLPVHIAGSRPQRGLPAVDAVGRLEQAEAAAIRDVLARNGGRRDLAARELGVSRTTLWRKIKRHGLA